MRYPPSHFSTQVERLSPHLRPHAGKFFMMVIPAVIGVLAPVLTEYGTRPVSRESPLRSTCYIPSLIPSLCSKNNVGACALWVCVFVCIYFFVDLFACLFVCCCTCMILRLCLSTSVAS